MRLKTFSGNNLRAAMAEVREVLGDDAIIVDTKTDKDGEVFITAATDDAKLERTVEHAVAHDPTPEENDADVVATALDYHGVPRRLSERLRWSAAHVRGDRKSFGLARALDEMFVFADFPPAPEKPIMLIGPTAAGKTVTAAKLATRSVINEHRVSVMTTDTVRAGAVAQLGAFTRLLKQPLQALDDTAALKDALNRRHPDDVAIIDTAGTNPFNAEDMALLEGMLAVDDIEPVLVMPAGGDAMEAAEVAEMFGRFRPKHLLVTRVDTARRFGSLLAAAYAGSLKFSLVSLTPYITNGLVPLNAKGMARLLLRDPNQSEIAVELQKAAK